MNRLLALVAFAILAAFLVILAIEVPSPDLIIVVVLTLILAAIDFLRSARSQRD